MNQMQRRLTVTIAAILAVLAWQQAAAETRRAHRPITPDRSASDLSRPKYPPTRGGDLSIRQGNEALRNHLLGQTPIGSSLRR
jgi:hypothetical protein